MEHHTLPVISGLLLLTSAPLCYSVSLPTGQPQLNTFYYNCYYIFLAQKKTVLAICVNQTSQNICIKNCIHHHHHIYHICIAPSSCNMFEGACTIKEIRGKKNINMI